MVRARNTDCPAFVRPQASKEHPATHLDVQQLGGVKAMLRVLRCAAYSFASLGYAVRTLHNDIFRFRFEYPLEIIPEAGPKESLHYYLYGRSLPWDRMRLDSNGIPREWERVTGDTYRPDYIACYGLTNLGHYLRNGNQVYLTVFLKQVDWLEKHAVVREDGAVIWPNNFDYPEGSVLLKAPWISANTHGFAISALVRGWRVTRRPHLLELLRRSAVVFRIDFDRNGIRMPADGHVLYTEKPGLPAPGILDGFMRSLLGLYDLFVETKDPEVGRLFTDGIKGLKYMLHRWDYKGKWSWYGNRTYLCPPPYHCLNRLLLTVLARLSGEPTFAEYAERWDPLNLTSLERGEIYLTYLFTKNACRLRYRTWRFRTIIKSESTERTKNHCTSVGTSDDDAKLLGLSVVASGDALRDTCT